MNRHSGCTHKFSYLLKKHDGGNYTGRVLQIPAVIADGRSKEEVSAEIYKGTLAYLDRFEEAHRKSTEGALESTLQTTENGIVLEIVPYQVTC